MSELFQLFAVFFRVGLFTFGGGYSMLPIIQRELVEKRGWLTQTEVVDYYAMAQCTPGIIMVNTAGLIGYRRGKAAGTIVSALGVVTPSLIIITLIAAFINRFAEHPLVQHALTGVRTAALALIIYAIVSLAKAGIKDWLCAGMAVASFVLVAFGEQLLGISINPVFVVIAAALIGLGVNMLPKKGEGKNNGGKKGGQQP